MPFILKSPRHFDEKASKDLYMVKKALERPLPWSYKALNALLKAIKCLFKDLKGPTYKILKGLINVDEYSRSSKHALMFWVFLSSSRLIAPIDNP